MMPNRQRTYAHMVGLLPVTDLYHICTRISNWNCKSMPRGYAAAPALDVYVMPSYVAVCGVCRRPTVPPQPRRAYSNSRSTDDIGTS